MLQYFPGNTFLNAKAPAAGAQGGRNAHNYGAEDPLDLNSMFGHRPQTAFSEENVTQLIAMGFARNQAEQALQNSPSIEAAIDVCMQYQAQGLFFPPAAPANADSPKSEVDEEELAKQLSMMGEEE